jgi:hypothetical protein
VVSIKLLACRRVDVARRENLELPGNVRQTRQGWAHALSKYYANDKIETSMGIIGVIRGWSPVSSVVGMGIKGL